MGSLNSVSVGSPAAPSDELHTRIAAVFTAYDLDSDHKLDQHEFLPFCRDMLVMTGRCAKRKMAVDFLLERLPASVSEAGISRFQDTFNKYLFASKSLTQKIDLKGFFQADPVALQMVPTQADAVAKCLKRFRRWKPTYIHLKRQYSRRALSVASNISTPAGTGAASGVSQFSASTRNHATTAAAEAALQHQHQQQHQPNHQQHQQLQAGLPISSNERSADFDFDPLSPVRANLPRLRFAADTKGDGDGGDGNGDGNAKPTNYNGYDSDNDSGGDDEEDNKQLSENGVDAQNTATQSSDRPTRAFSLPAPNQPFHPNGAPKKRKFPKTPRVVSQPQPS